MPNAQISRADGIQFQAWLHARQYPADCSGSIGMYTRQDYFYSLGLGAQMVSLKYGLLWALLQGSVYHFPTSHYVNPVRCASRSFDCYFEPPSNCTRPASAVGGGGGGGRRGRQLGQRSPAELRRRRPWLAATTSSNRSQHRAAEEVTNLSRAATRSALAAALGTPVCNPRCPGCSRRCSFCSPGCPGCSSTCGR